MKKMYVFLCGIVMMTLGFAACSDDNGKVMDAYTEAEKQWIAENEEYFQARLAEREDDGSFLYKRLVVDNDTLLYRILSEGEGMHPTSTSNVKVSILGKLPVSNTIIAGESDETPIDDTLDLDSQYLIKGLAALLLEVRVGDRVETIIPYELGYGDQNYTNPYIPLCSTLMFTFTVNSFE